MTDPDYNLTHTVKIDEVGEIIKFTCEDAGGPVDLTSYTVTMTIKKDGVVATLHASCTKYDQTARPGECFHTWTSDSIPDVPGVYQGEIKAQVGGDKLYWPKNPDGSRTYFTLIVQEALDA